MGEVMKLFLFFMFLFSASSWGAGRNKIKEETMTLKCQAGACPDMAGYDGPCSAGWVVENGEVPVIYARGSLPECKCTSTSCVPKTPIQATGVVEKDLSVPNDISAKIFKVKTVLEK
jgi:hypothetical protein